MYQDSEAHPLPPLADLGSGMPSPPYSAIIRVEIMHGRQIEAFIFVSDLHMCFSLES